VRVLLVCDGNICRSPMAAAYLRSRAAHAGLAHVVIDSAGLLGIEGAPAAAHAIAVGRAEGFDLTRHRSRGITAAEWLGNADENESIPGLMHVNLGGYHIRDIEFSAAIDVDADKVGKDLSEAIWGGQNNTIKFTDVPHLGVPVLRGTTLDGLGTYLRHLITEADGEPVDLVKLLRDTKTDVVVTSNEAMSSKEETRRMFME